MSQTENIKDVHTQKGRSDLYKPKGRWRGNEPYRGCKVLTSYLTAGQLETFQLLCYTLIHCSQKINLQKVTSFFNFFKNNLVGSLCIKDAQIFV